MLAALGLDSSAERVYREMIAQPDIDIIDLADAVGFTIEETREALDSLFELALVRESADRPGLTHAVSPEAGLRQALARQQAELAARQQQVAECQIAVLQLIEDFGAKRSTTDGSMVRPHAGMDAVRDALDQISRDTQFEILTFMPGGAHKPASLEHAQRNNLKMMARGVRFRCIGLDSIRNDAATLDYARVFSDHGGEYRTTPTLPPRMILADRRTALVPIDPQNTSAGLLELVGPGLVTPMLALFEQIWEIATPFGAVADPEREGLTKQEQVLLKLLAQGLTDLAAATRLGVSQRTARRMVAGLMERMEARSRFEAGLKAAQRGWL
jgi:DNA-binding CsgD family transcriptional regulator/DNA-binding transcriptional MerR regulator